MNYTPSFSLDPSWLSVKEYFPQLSSNITAVLARGLQACVLQIKNIKSNDEIVQPNFAFQIERMLLGYIMIPVTPLTKTKSSPLPRHTCNVDRHVYIAK